MNLKEILQKIVSENLPILLCDSDKEWEASVLLEELTEPRLKVNAHLQSGLYIAEIDHGGYLGRVLYRIKQK